MGPQIGIQMAALYLILGSNDLILVEVGVVVVFVVVTVVAVMITDVTLCYSRFILTHVCL